MIYLDLTDKIEKNNVIKILKEYNLNNKIIDKDKLIDDENELEKIKKADFIISDGEIETLKDYHALNKNVIIYRNRKSKNVDLFYEKGVYTYKYSNELREIINHLEKQSKKKKALLKLPLLFLIIVIIISILLAIYNNHQKELEREEKISQEEVAKKKKELERKAENIVFFGDSITDFYDLNKYYKGYNVVNSGISGNTTQDLLDNIKDRVYIYNPTKVFLLIGTNDTELTDLSNKEIANNIEKIIKKIQENRPKAKIYVESIYPVNNSNAKKIDHNMVKNRNNKQIKQINAIIINKCKKLKVKYINMYAELADEEGNLNINYTKEGLHLNDNGYKVVTEKLLSYINN